MILLTSFLLLALFGVAARQDVLTRLIPEIVPAGICVIAIAARVAAGPRAMAESLLAGGGVFVVLFFAYSRGAIGGGDVKLLTALSLGLPPLGTLHFIVATAMAGGVVGIAYYGLGRLQIAHGTHYLPPIRRIFAIECWRARRFRAVPYAVAIATGAAIVLLPPVLTQIAGIVR